MKETAVEQFIEQLEKQGDSWENVSTGTINISIKVEDYLKLKEKAKEMGKQQICDAYRVGWINYLPKTDSEEYYQETFKSE
jgi:hypothetical protein